MLVKVDDSIAGHEAVGFAFADRDDCACSFAAEDIGKAVGCWIEAGAEVAVLILTVISNHEYRRS